MTMRGAVGELRPDSPTSTSMNSNRCDGCAARAAFEIQLSSGKSIFLCGHHTKRNMDALVKQGALVVEMEKI